MGQLVWTRKGGVMLTLLLVALLAGCGSEEGLDEAAASQPAELRWITFDLNSQVEKLLAMTHA